jgi:hypothetical protein
MEGNWQATEVGLQVNLGRETATRAAKRLIMLPPFAPAAETWARTTVESNICTKCAVSLIAARPSKNASKVPDRLHPGRPGADRGAGRRSGKGQDREGGPWRVYVLCRQSEGRLGAFTSRPSSIPTPRSPAPSFTIAKRRSPRPICSTTERSPSSTATMSTCCA